MSQLTELDSDGKDKLIQALQLELAAFKSGSSVNGKAEAKESSLGGSVVVKEEGNESNDPNEQLKQSIESFLKSDYSEEVFPDNVDILASSVKTMKLDESGAPGEKAVKLEAVVKTEEIPVIVKAEPIVYATPGKPSPPPRPRQFNENCNFYKDTEYATCVSGTYERHYKRYVVVNYGIKTRQPPMTKTVSTTIPTFARSEHGRHTNIIARNDIQVAADSDCGGSVYRYTFSDHVSDEDIVTFAKSTLNQLANLVLYYGTMDGDKIHVYFCTGSYGGWFHHHFDGNYHDVNAHHK